MTSDLRQNPNVTDPGRQSYSEMPQSGTSSAQDLYQITPADTDSPSGMGETSWTPDWSKWHGAYKTIPEFAQVIDTLAKWTMGRGLKASVEVKKILKKITGSGKDTFTGIMKNMLRTGDIAGDSFAEIITSDGKKANGDNLENLKMFNPGRIKIIEDGKGFITRYDQLSLADKEGKRQVIGTFEPWEILHFPMNKIADEIHGKPFGERVENLIKMRNESMQDLQIVFHRYVDPLTIFFVNTDDTTEVNNFATKVDQTYKTKSKMILPANTVDSIERVSIPQFSTLDPLPWLRLLLRMFTTAAGVPEIVMGWGEETTEASAKIIYLAFQQVIEDRQLEIEEQLEAQLGIEINLEFPASIEPEPTQAKSISEGNKKAPGLSSEGVDPRKDQK